MDSSSRHRSCFQTLPFFRGKAQGEGVQGASQGKQTMVLLRFMEEGLGALGPCHGEQGMFLCVQR